METKTTTLITARPTPQLIGAFEFVRNQCPALSKASYADLVETAMGCFVRHGKEEETLLNRAIIMKVPDGSNVPSTFSIRIDESLYQNCLSLFRDTLGIFRVKQPFLLRAILVYYALRQPADTPSAIDSADKVVTAGMLDYYAFKMAYETYEMEPGEKNKLYEKSKRYLEENPDILDRLRTGINIWIRGISDYYNRLRYSPIRQRTLGTTNIIFITKVYCGLILVISETQGITLKELMDELKENR